jgi:hypothetical protein
MIHLIMFLLTVLFIVGLIFMITIAACYSYDDSPTFKRLANRLLRLEDAQ